MKPRRRDKSDQRIAQLLKATMLDQRPPVASRYQLMQTAASGKLSAARRASWAVRPNWSTPSSDRRRREQLALQGRNYGYIAVTASFRLAW